MDNKIEIFKNEQFGEVRTILEGEKVLFCAADVAKASPPIRPPMIKFNAKMPTEPGIP